MPKVTSSDLFVFSLSPPSPWPASSPSSPALLPLSGQPQLPPPVLLLQSLVQLPLPPDLLSYPPDLGVVFHFDVFGKDAFSCILLWPVWVYCFRQSTKDLRHPFRLYYGVFRDLDTLRAGRNEMKRAGLIGSIVFPNIYVLTLSTNFHSLIHIHA